MTKRDSTTATAIERQQRAEELARFKREIDLVRFAEGFNYQVVQRSGSYTRLQRAEGDQIIVTRETDGTYVYVNPTNCEPHDRGTPKPSGMDQGTIVDFLQREKRLDIAGVRKALRRELGAGNPREGGRPSPSPPQPPQMVSHPTFDRDAVTRSLLAAVIVKTDPYLEGRGLRPEILASTRFAGTFRVRPHSGEVIFPHRDEAGFTGFERKAARYTLFATGGRRAVWHSTLTTADRVLVVAESAIDAMSYHQLNPRSDARYMSTGGTMSRGQLELLGRAIAKMPAGSTFVIATDNDPAGRKLAAKLELIARERAPALKVECPLPPFGKDWNDVLKDREREFIAQVARRLSRGRGHAR